MQLSICERPVKSGPLMKTSHKSLFHFYKYAKGNKISIAGVLSVVEAFEVFDRDKPTKRYIAVNKYTFPCRL